MSRPHTLNTLTGAHLVFPLRRHDLSIGTSDVHTSIHAGFVMSFDNITTERPSSPDPAVVRTLSTWESVLGPAVWTVIDTEESILLLETKPEFVMLICFHQAGGIVTVVEFVGAPIWIPCLAHDDDVGFQTERIGEDSDGANVDIRVVAGSLAG